MESRSMILVCSLFSVSSYNPGAEELAALVNDGAKASIIEIPPCFSTSFVQVESWRGAQSLLITGSFSLSVSPYAPQMRNLAKQSVLALHGTVSLTSFVVLSFLHQNLPCGR